MLLLAEDIWFSSHLTYNNYRAAIQLKIIIVINRAIKIFNRDYSQLIEPEQETSLWHRITVKHMILLVLHDVSANKMY